MRAVELPASVDERVDGQKRVAVGASGKRAGKVVVRSQPVCLGQDGGERGHQFGGCAVVEADAPGRWAEGVLVGVDPPQPVVVAFREIAEADLAVGGREVDAADVVVAQIPAEGAQRVEPGITDRGGTGQVAWGDVDVAVDGVVVVVRH
ncbi:hypothetical protein ADK87_35230 [Streptomyces sp. NRRL F-4711]|nr:hypothetical protein ADK87_35230 [Streptomyces sp. NRRL F-4711]